MRGKKRKGATLSMVIVTVVLLTALIAIIATIIDTNSTQTMRVRDYLSAKYLATSGTQVALGAYYYDQDESDKKSPDNDLYRIFANRLSGADSSTGVITSTYKDQDGRTAEIEISGDFAEDPVTGQKSTNISDYHITFKSRAKMDSVNRYYVHTVVINYETRGIRSEKGGLE